MCCMQWLCMDLASIQPLARYSSNASSLIIILVSLPLGPMRLVCAKHLASTTASSKEADLPCARNGAVACIASPASVTGPIQLCCPTVTSGA
ncbi:hypothetical protein ABKV19_026321 [Rosa sericea]